MHDVAIVGAGELGGAIAHALARRDVVASIQLVDETGQVAAGKALDIMHAGAIEGFATRVSGTTDIFEAGAASLIVIADRAVPGHSVGTEWQGAEGLALLGRIGQMTRDTLVVCAGTEQRELVERGVRELRFSDARLFGSAPEALASAIRAVVALEANVSPRDIALTVLGIPPTQTVVPWEQATIAGLSLSRALDDTACRRLSARAAMLWPPGPHALAAAAVKAMEAISGVSRQTISAFVASGDGSGTRIRASALPTRLGPEGIVEAKAPALSAYDRVALDNARLL